MILNLHHRPDHQQRQWLRCAGRVITVSAQTTPRLDEDFESLDLGETAPDYGLDQLADLTE